MFMVAGPAVPPGSLAACHPPAPSSGIPRAAGSYACRGVPYPAAPGACPLVRETLSFSKKLANHTGAMKYFICHDNLSKVAAAALPV
jgi:hypothetical protein